ncbi:uncharacterized protein LOC121731210 [Aricia agestis]|uniref:uncharacterized protein LOC121731210 n=1 Tax=Aricia agestis TaxID=91739 RepID=UPI001C20AE56|nr:uncharacterized protein LOC121731210 [Aricia agestis]
MDTFYIHFNYGMILLLWSLLYTTSIFLNTIEYQKFYTLIRDIGVACLLKLNHYDDVPECCRRMCKSIIRLNSGISEFGVYGLFAVNMFLNLSILSVITSYVVVLLQFVLL